MERTPLLSQNFAAKDVFEQTSDDVVVKIAQLLFGAYLLDLYLFVGYLILEP